MNYKLKQSDIIFVKTCIHVLLLYFLVNPFYLAIIDEFFKPIDKNNIINNTVTNIAREEFVKEMSYPSTSMGTIVLISN